MRPNTFLVTLSMPFPWNLLLLLRLVVVVVVAVIAVIVVIAVRRRHRSNNRSSSSSSSSKFVVVVVVIEVRRTNERTNSQRPPRYMYPYSGIPIPTPLQSYQNHIVSDIDTHTFSGRCGRADERTNGTNERLIDSKKSTITLINSLTHSPRTHTQSVTDCE